MLDYILSFVTIDHSVAAGVGLVSAPALAWVKNAISKAIADFKAFRADLAAFKAKLSADAVAVQAPAPAVAPVAPAHVGG